MKLFFLISALFISTFLFSQNSHKTDSLQTLLQTIKEESADKKRIANALNSIGLIYEANNNYTKALEYYSNAILASKKAGDQQLIAQSLHNIGNIYESQGDYTKALDYFERALKVKEEIGDKKNIALTLNNIGLVYQAKGDYSKALELYFKVLKTCGEFGKQQSTANALLNIGNIYYAQLEDQQALNYYERSLQVAQEISGGGKIIAGLYINIANVYLHKNASKKALNYYFKALQIGKQIGEKECIANSLQGIGYIYLNEKKWTNALEYYQKSLQVYEAIGYKKEIATTCCNIGLIYSEQNKYQDALVYQKKGLKLAKEVGNIELIKNAEKLLSELYEQQNNTADALIHYKEYISMHDSMFNETKSKQIAEIQTKYETDKKKKEIELLSKEKIINKAQLQLRNLILGVSVLLFVLLFVIYSRYRIKRQLVIEKQLIETEQKLLRLQMNPHFIFNALTAVQGFINSDKRNEAGVYLAKISRLIRAILENSREEYVSFKKEIQSLENYLSINQLLMDNELGYKIEIDDEIEKETTLIPPMLAQPFIENALKHGLQAKQDKGLIVIRFKNNKQTLLFEVEDNGIGLIKSEKKQEDKHHQSLATTITKERLSNLLKVSVNNIQINVNELKNTDGLTLGTKTSFEIPIKQL